MYVYHNIETESVLETNTLYARSTLIERLSDHFETYGYRKVSTSMFEKYNLYATMNGTVNHREMVKTIDNTGQVLVLRPDITIPLTKQLATTTPNLTKDLRYYYVLDVYRQAPETHEYEEHTQAGVEYFGNPSPEADGEIIALAANFLRGLQVGTFTIEIGHADFFKEIIANLPMSEEQLRELKRLIRGKNVPDIEQFVETLHTTEEKREVIKALTLLYGKLPDVLEKVQTLPLTEQLKEKLSDIEKIYTVLEAYEVTEHIVIDLSLINHMDYYSAIIFQGFIEQIGKPILMGGRYDALASHFDADFPAIGFAFDIDLLLAGSSPQKASDVPPLHFVIPYEKPCEKEAISLAQNLRTHNFDVVTYTNEVEKEQLPNSQGTIAITEKETTYKKDDTTETYTDLEQLVHYIVTTWREA